MSPRALLLLPTTTYKSRDFLEAAERLGVEVVVGTDRRQALEAVSPGHTLTLDFSRPDTSVRVILDGHRRAPFDAVIGADDETTLLASRAGSALGLRANPEDAVRAARDKYRMRTALTAAGLRSPRFQRVALDASAREAAGRTDYPCVLKPLCLSASRGVMRADDADGFVAAFERIKALLGRRDVRPRAGDAASLLVEDYLSGTEVALEGLLTGGRLRVLALFDKPDPLVGPTFEETLYVTPSRLARPVQAAIADEAARACRALGLVEGPVHAELRLPGELPYVLEVAARSIGGLCSRALRFGTGVSLEELILRHALGLDVQSLLRERCAAGVMMIPIPAAGILQGVDGLDEARAVPGIEELTLTLHVGAELVPLPEGNQYLGFIFARAERPEQAEAALRAAHALLRFKVRG